MRGSFINACSKGEQLGLTKAEDESLAATYGSNIEAVYNLLSKNIEDAKTYGLPLHLFSKLVYAMEQEMVATPIDFLNRRTGAIFFNIQLVQKWKRQVITYMGDKFNWTEHQMKQYSLALEESLTRAVTPIDEQDSITKVASGH